jgi:hypothetical protein
MAISILRTAAHPSRLVNQEKAHRKRWAFLLWGTPRERPEKTDGFCRIPCNARFSILGSPSADPSRMRTREWKFSDSQGENRHRVNDHVPLGL